MSSAIHSEQRGKVLAISIQYPEKKNALTKNMYRALTKLLAQADQEDSIHVIHLTGCDNCFCSGNDLQDFIAVSKQDEQSDNPPHLFLQQLHRQSKPIVAAVNGVAVGIGVTMLLHCDFVYAAEGSPFKLPFVDLGLVPEGGSSAILPQMLGHRRAAELLLACKGFKADEAAEIGIVNQVFPADQLLEQSWAMAELLANKPPKALQQAKIMMKNNPTEPLAKVIDTEIELFMKGLTEPEFKQAVQAFFGSGK